MTRNKSLTRKPNPQFDHEGQVDVEATIEEREYAYGPPTSYQAPQPADKMRALYAIGLEPLSKSAKAVFTVLVWHANSKNGRCDPGQARIAYETDLTPRTVKRAIIELRRAGFIYRTRRGAASNAYQIRWDYLRSIFDEFEGRVKAYRSEMLGEVTEVDRDESTEPPGNTRGQDCHLGGDRTVTSQVTGMTPKPIKLTLEGNPFPERADCASHKSADVIPLEEKRATRKEQTLRTQYASSALPEEEGITQPPNIVAAEKAVRLAISIHPKIELLEAAFDADAELYFEAIREEAARTSGGNAFLWTIVRERRQAGAG